MGSLENTEGEFSHGEYRINTYLYVGCDIRIFIYSYIHIFAYPRTAYGKIWGVGTLGKLPP